VNGPLRSGTAWHPQAAIAIAVALLLLLAATGAAAQPRIHRCIGEHGEIAFSDRPCAAGRVSATPDAGAPAGVSGVAGTACATSIEALRDRVAAAFRRSDPNVIAGLLRWEGVGGAEANRRMRELAALVALPLVELRTDGDFDDSEDDDDGQADAYAYADPRADTAFALPAIVLRSGDERHGTREHAFALVRDAGCLWLHW
jgi:hypothetical protein